MAQSVVGERERVTERARSFARAGRAALFEFEGFTPDFYAGLYGPQRSNHADIGEDGLVTIESPYPDPFWALMVIRDRDGAPIITAGPKVLTPGSAMTFDLNDFELAGWG